MTYLYTTDNSTAFIVVDGNDEADAKEKADQAIQTLPGCKLTGQQHINHSIIVNLAITLLNKAKADDILIRRLTEYFGKRAVIELKNDVHDDGSVRKRFLVNGKDEIYLDLKNKMQVDSYEDKGLNEDHMKVIMERLEGVVKREEMTISGPDGEVEPVIGEVENVDEPVGEIDAGNSGE